MVGVLRFPSFFPRGQEGAVCGHFVPCVSGHLFRGDDIDNRYQRDERIPAEFH